MRFNLPGSHPGLAKALGDWIKQKFSRPLWLFTAATVDLPTLAEHGANEGALAYDETVDAPVYRDGSGWVRLASYDATIAALAALDSSAGILCQTGTDTFAKRTLTAPAAGITVSNGTGAAGNPTLALANDLAALEALSGTNTIYYRSAADTWTAVTIGSNLSFSGGVLSVTESFVIACSDEVTELTTGTAKVTFRMPYAFTLSAVRASLTTAPTGSTLVVDINEGGTTILSTKLSIDAGEKTSTTAATAAVISDTSLADDAEITIDIDQVGSTIPGAGLKVALIGKRT